MPRIYTALLIPLAVTLGALAEVKSASAQTTYPFDTSYNSLVLHSQI